MTMEASPYAIPGISLTPTQVIEIWKRHYPTHVFMEVKSYTRKEVVSIPRQVLMYCLRKYTGMSYGKIAEYVNRKEHSTVMNGVRRVEDTYLHDRELKDHITMLLEDLNEIAGVKTKNSIQVEITRDDLYKLLPDLSEEDKKQPMIWLWTRYKAR